MGQSVDVGGALLQLVRSGHEISGAAGCWLPRQSRRRLALPG